MNRRIFVLGCLLVVTLIASSQEDRTFKVTQVGQRRIVRGKVKQREKLSKPDFLYVIVYNETDGIIRFKNSRASVLHLELPAIDKKVKYDADGDLMVSTSYKTIDEDDTRGLVIFIEYPELGIGNLIVIYKNVSLEFYLVEIDLETLICKH